MSYLTNVLIIALLSGSIASCGYVKFAGTSGEQAGGKTEQPVDQPTEVAGGLGLVCTSTDNADDASKTDISCSFVNESGQVFQETAEKKLDLQVKLGEQLVTVTREGSQNSANFKFTLLKTEVEKADVQTKLVNPQDGNEIIAVNNSKLSSVTLSVFNLKIQTPSPSTNVTPTIQLDLSKNAKIQIFTDMSCSQKNSEADLLAGIGRTITLAALEVSKAHSIYLKPVDTSAKAGNTHACLRVGYYTTQLPAPENFSVTSAASGTLEINLGWGAVTSVSSAITYRIYFKENESGVNYSNNSFDGISSTSYRHTNRTAGSTYYYRVAAVANGEVGVLSEERSAVAP